MEASRNIPQWTRAELAAAETLAELMGISRASVLKQYMPELRRLEAAEHKVPEDEWVKAKLHTNWVLSEVQDRMKQGQAPEDIGRFVRDQIGMDSALGTAEDLTLLRGFMAAPTPPKARQ